MKRSEFLKRLGLGIAAIPFAKQVAGAVTEKLDPEVFKEPGELWYADPLPKHFDGFTFSHYEEPWVHRYGWPYRVNDIILTESDDQYLVVHVRNGEAVCMSMDGSKPNIVLNQDSEKAIIISNSKSEL